MSGNTSPKKWWQVYPMNDPSGAEESAFFFSLARHPDFAWRRAEGVAEETGLPVERIKEFLARYEPTGMIVNHPTKPELWAYWERAGSLPGSVEPPAGRRLET